MGKSWKIHEHPLFQLGHFQVRKRAKRFPEGKTPEARAMADSPDSPGAPGQAHLEMLCTRMIQILEMLTSIGRRSSRYLTDLKGTEELRD